MPRSIEEMSVNRTVDLVTPLASGEMVLERMSGTETLGRLFEYELTVFSENGDIVFDDVLGRHVTAMIEQPDGSRRAIDGRVAQMSLVDMAGNYYRYRLVLRPWLWMLSLTTDCKIFQDKTVQQIIEEVFADQPDATFEFSLTTEYATRVYCVQYRETDLDFVHRLMEEEGLYYFYRHEEGKHTVVICDSPGAHTSVGEVPFMPRQRTGSSGTENIREWSITREIRPGKTVLRDYDFERPSVDTTVVREHTRPHAEASHEIYDYPGDYVDMSVGEHLVRNRLDELQASHEVIEGRGSSHIIATGSTFTFCNFGRKDQNGDFLVVSTSIQASNNLLESNGQAGETDYDISFRLIKASEPYRSPRITPRPIVQGLQTALVVGPAGETIFTDKFGRVKVQFHWDRYGKKNDASSCWIRVSQNWGGKDWGGMFIPHVGQEVIVHFLEGDPHRPMITGRVYNQEQMPPIALPGGKTQSIIRDHGGNEIIMEGAEGSQKMKLYSPTHKTELVLGNSVKMFSESNFDFTSLAAWNAYITGTTTYKIGGDFINVVIGKHDVKIGGDVLKLFMGAEHSTIIGLTSKLIGGLKHETVKGIEMKRNNGTKVEVTQGAVVKQDKAKTYDLTSATHTAKAMTLLQQLKVAKLIHDSHKETIKADKLEKIGGDLKTEATEMKVKAAGYKLSASTIKSTVESMKTEADDILDKASTIKEKAGKFLVDAKTIFNSGAMEIKK